MPKLSNGWSTSAMSNTENSFASLSRRSFLAQSSILLAGHSALTHARTLGASESPDYVEVKTAYGRLRGVAKNGVVTFKGVPYAGSVSGANRFKAAPRLQPWSGVRDAFQFGTPAMQRPERPSFGTTEPMPGENCLFLNVWTPTLGANAPSCSTRTVAGSLPGQLQRRIRTAEIWLALGMSWL